MKKVILYFFIIGGILNFTITDNLYSQWVTQHSGTTAALYDINFIDENIERALVIVVVKFVIIFLCSSSTPLSI